MREEEAYNERSESESTSSVSARATSQIGARTPFLHPASEEMGERQKKFSERLADIRTMESDQEERDYGSGRVGMNSCT